MSEKFVLKYRSRKILSDSDFKYKLNEAGDIPVNHSHKCADKQMQISISNQTPICILL